jgi:hypothetical protein
LHWTFRVLGVAKRRRLPAEALAKAGCKPHLK